MTATGNWKRIIRHLWPTIILPSPTKLNLTQVRLEGWWYRTRIGLSLPPQHLQASRPFPAGMMVLKPFKTTATWKFIGPNSSPFPCWL